jgi:ribonuclease HII
VSALDQRLHELSVGEIAAILDRRQTIGRTTVRHLMCDPRAGVRALGLHYLERARAREREKRRLARLLELERSLSESAVMIAGVDEAGMAPIAGPVVAAAVVLPPEWMPLGLDDSKRLDPASRERLDVEIRCRALAVGVGVVSERVIDRVNIYQASLLAMKLALRRLSCRIDLALLDGRPPRTFPFPHRAVVGGDRRVRSIAAASIIAKVARDRLLCEAHARWPHYGFDHHKGYMTPAHIRALREHGLSPIHRLSWPRVWEEADAMGPLYRELFEGFAAAETAAALEAAEFAFDSARPSLHASEEKLLQRLLEARRAAVAEVGHGP